MRAGPLSNPKVIELLNSYFVPVYTSNDEIIGDEEFVRKEAAERRRIYGAFVNSKLGSGTVTPHILTWDAKPLAHLGIGQATTKDNLLQFLEKAVADLKVPKGEPVVKPAPQAPPPQVPADGLLLHLTARKLHKGGSWNEFPSEVWLVLKTNEWSKLTPPADAKAGTTWDVDRDVAASILTHFYPQTEVCTAKDDKLLSATSNYQHRIDEQSLKAKVLSVQDGVVRVRLDGFVKLHHNFYPGRPDPTALAQANVLGFFDYDTAKKKIATLRLVSDGGKYANTTMGIAVRSMP